MSTRPKVRAETDAKIKELSAEISRAREKAEDLKRAAQSAKAAYKKTRRAFKQAKKLAREARKKVKELKKTLHAATRAAAQPLPRKKSSRTRTKAPGQKDRGAKPAVVSAAVPTLQNAPATPPENPVRSSAEMIAMPVAPSIDPVPQRPEPA